MIDVNWTPGWGTRATVADGWLYVVTSHEVDSQHLPLIMVGYSYTVVDFDCLVAI